MTPKQTSLFWRTFSAACAALGIQGTEAREEYRRQVLEEEAHVSSTKLVNSTDGFDSVMARLTADAGDYLAAANYAIGDARRMSAMVCDCAIQVLLLSGSPADPADYLRGILRQSLLGTSIGDSGDVLLDVDYGSIRKVFQMLDTHRRRLLRRAGVDKPLAFQMGARKVVVSGVLIDSSPPVYALKVRCRAA